MIFTTYLLPAGPSLQLEAASPSGGETCHCSAAGPDRQRSAAGYTPCTASRPRPDLEETDRDEPDCWWFTISMSTNLGDNIKCDGDKWEPWCWNRSITCLLDGGVDGCRCRVVHQLLAHPTKGKDLPTLQQLRGAERSLHPWREAETHHLIKKWSIVVIYNTWLTY